ncbi:hypothetical protein LAZ67_X002697 [Cordylochernes scorpioides]|uniref:Uncharacterized protein n=1 Tax=Cordylochernes scorpioides TaxID=51811 RepID=A0ABY6LU26_9ARAC|nr:hypothetical protein LAZ67_X002697 [Cordylochernes scorpioides]
MEDEQSTEVKNSGNVTREEGADAGEASPLVEVLLQLPSVLAQTRSSDRAETELPPFRGSYSARQFFQSYDRKMDDAPFIPDYARLRTPLVNLLKREVTWVWYDECQKAFTSLKESLTTHPILHLYKEGVLKQVHPDGKTYTKSNPTKDQLIERQDVIFTKVGGSMKRPHDPDHAKSEAKKGCVQAPGMLLNSSRPRATPRPSKVHDCQTTKQKQATFRARLHTKTILPGVGSEAGQGNIYQLTKMEGHILPGLSSVKLADKLIEEGLGIEDATLRVFPLRKRAERIVLGNVLFFVEDADLVAALRPYGQVTFMIQKMSSSRTPAGLMLDGKKFITLRVGVKLSQIPARLEVKSKGMVTHVYVTYGIKCSLCHKQGHKRANCPSKTGLQEDKLVLPVDVPAPRTQGWTMPPSTSNTMPAAAPTPAEQTPPTAALEPAPRPTSSSPAAPSPEANIPVHPQETTTSEPPFPAPSTSQLLPRPESSLAIIDPTARKRPGDSGLACRKAKRGCVQAAAAKQVLTERPIPKSKEVKLGKGSVYQLRKMERHIPPAEKSRTQYARQCFLFRGGRRPCRSTWPYGQVEFIVQKMMEMGDSSWADARWDAFITLKDGIKLSQIPARLDVKSKRIATQVYVTYGIKCSLYNRQGHKRANCPRKTGLQERHLLLPVDAPLVPTAVTSKPPPKSNAPPLPVAALPPAFSVVADPPPSDTEKSKEAVGLSAPPSKKQDEPMASESSQ